MVSTEWDAPFLIGLAGLVALVVGNLAARAGVRAGLLLDRPNGRSSHDSVTPRSGGIAIFAGWSAGMALIAAASGDVVIVDLTMRLALVAFFVFVLGLIDDMLALRAYLKLIGQIAAAALFVAAFGPLEAAPLPIVGEIAFGPYATFVTLFWIVAFMNAFNFMDGVNGIAASCGAFALAGLAVASAYAGAGFWAIAAALAAVALVAFLPVNFPHGRLFMGDNGSQTAGFLIAGIAVAAANDTGGAVGALFAPTAMLPFLFDVAFTLAHRLLRGRNILAAHREHLYQLLLRLGYSHARVTAVYLSLTALSTAGAVLMLRLPPDQQLYAPLALAFLFAAPAFLLFARACGRGLLNAPNAAAPEEDLSKKAEIGSLATDAAAHAAE
ncbi:MAG: glycosyltransferase family 4 protein [Amphiplicatus sp.]